MPRLRRIDCSEPGIRRVRRGRGFSYQEEDGTRISDREVIERIDELVIPPPGSGSGSAPTRAVIQATGYDVAGRKQYLYHPYWRESRDREKFASMESFARALPGMRERTGADLARRGLARERVLAWSDVRAPDVNEYLKAVMDGDYTAKDFRTWNATVLAAVELATSGGEAATKTARKRAATEATKRVAAYLSNTPAVCRSAYIDPRVFDRYDSGETIAGSPRRIVADGDPGAFADRERTERAVLKLLR